MVVIGGGIVGLSTAFQLAKRGVSDVVVLERRQLGAGATGKQGHWCVATTPMFPKRD